MVSSVNWRHILAGIVLLFVHLPQSHGDQLGSPALPLPHLSLILPPSRSQHTIVDPSGPISITKYPLEAPYITTEPSESLYMTTDPPEPLQSKASDFLNNWFLLLNKTIPSNTTDSPEPTYITTDPLYIDLAILDEVHTITEPPVSSYQPITTTSNTPKPLPRPPGGFIAWSPLCPCYDCIYGCWDPGIITDGSGIIVLSPPCLCGNCQTGCWNNKQHISLP